MEPRVVVVGAGHLGTYHLEKLAASQRADLVGVVDVSTDTRERAAERFGIRAAADIEAFAGACDAAIIATPTTTHLEVASRALELGWHVLVEKPIAATVDEARELVDLATRVGRIVQVGHVERFNPAVAAALGIADRPRYIVAERLGRFSGRSTDVDVVLDLMIHDLDIVGALVNAPLAEIRAVGVPVMTQEIDMASARLAFADGTVAQLSAGRASLEPSRKLRIFTTQRYVSIDCAKREVKSVRRLPPDPSSPWPQITGELLDVPPGDPLSLQDEDFITCIREGRRPRVDGQAGLRALELAQAIKEAMTVPLADVGFEADAATFSSTVA
jgi:predicted dehydrogenase